MHSGIFFLLAMELLYKSVIALVVVVLLAYIATAVATYGTRLRAYSESQPWRYRPTKPLPLVR